MTARLRALALLMALQQALVAPAAAAPVRQSQPPAGIVIDQLHMIVTVSEDMVWISEVYLLGNEGEASHGGDGEITVVFPLPEGAAQVSYEGAEDGTGPYRPVDGGIADTRPIPPGVAMLEARLTYALLYRPGMRIAHALPLPLKSGVLLLSGTAWKLTGSEVDTGAYTDLGVMAFGGEPSRAYMIAPLGAGETLAFGITGEAGALGLAESGAPVRQAGSGVELGVGLVALAASIAASAWLWRRKPDARAAAPPATVASDLDAIVELDCRFEGAEIDLKAYRRARQELKARIKRVLAAHESHD